jgi:peptidoglycan/xylan/chitin deacetylase (PgdA/CDA1 family)
VPELVLTIDNLGEANELERGTWDGSAALGRHPSVTIALPRLLDVLAQHELTATFCVEAINCRLNPEAVLSIAEHGHEIAAHGYRHEQWASLSPGREGEILARARLAYGALGLHPRGFRPPGGGFTPDTPRLLREHGFTWASPERASIPTAPDPGRLAWVPFVWQDVDALYLMDAFAGLRRRRGLSQAPVSAVGAFRALESALGATGRRTVVLHPFLMLDQAWWEQTRRFLADLARRVAAGTVRCRTAGEVAGG